MERPLKRPRLGQSPLTQKAAEEEDELGLEPEEFRVQQDPGYQLQKSRAVAAFKLKSTFESIFEKYEKDFTGVGDEIDLRTGEIVVDNGHIQSMQDDQDAAKGKRTAKQVEGPPRPGQADAASDIDTDEEEERILHGRPRPEEQPGPVASALVPRSLSGSADQLLAGSWPGMPSLMGGFSRISVMFPSRFQAPPPLMSFGSFGYPNNDVSVDPAWRAPDLPPSAFKSALRTQHAVRRSSLVPTRTAVRRSLLMAQADDEEEDEDVLLGVSSTASRPKPQSPTSMREDDAEDERRKTAGNMSSSNILETYESASPDEQSRVQSKPDTDQTIGHHAARTQPTFQISPKKASPFKGQKGKGDGGQRVKKKPARKAKPVVVIQELTESQTPPAASRTAAPSHSSVKLSHTTVEKFKPEASPETPRKSGRTFQIIVAVRSRRGRPIELWKSPGKGVSFHSDALQKGPRAGHASSSANEYQSAETGKEKDGPAPPPKANVPADMDNTNSARPSTPEPQTKEPELNIDGLLTPRTPSEKAYEDDRDPVIPDSLNPSPTLSVTPTKRVTSQSRTMAIGERFARNFLDPAYAFSDDEEDNGPLSLPHEPKEHEGRIPETSSTVGQPISKSITQKGKQPTDHEVSASTMKRQQRPARNTRLPVAVFAGNPDIVTQDIGASPTVEINKPIRASRSNTKRKRQSQQEDANDATITPPDAPISAAPADWSENPSQEGTETVPQQAAPVTPKPATKTKPASKRRSLAAASSGGLVSLVSDEEEDELSLGPGDFTPSTARRVLLLASARKSATKSSTFFRRGLLLSSARGRKLLRTTTPVKRKTTNLALADTAAASGGSSGGGPASSPAGNRSMRMAMGTGRPFLEPPNGEGSPRGSPVRTRGGTVRRCGQDGFRCDRDFCFVCL